MRKNSTILRKCSIFPFCFCKWRTQHVLPSSSCCKFSEGTWFNSGECFRQNIMVMISPFYLFGHSVIIAQNAQSWTGQPVPQCFELNLTVNSNRGIFLYLLLFRLTVINARGIMEWGLRSVASSPAEQIPILSRWLIPNRSEILWRCAMGGRLPLKISPELGRGVLSREDWGRRIPLFQWSEDETANEAFVLIMEE